jgi:ribosome-binding factor A
VTSDLQIARVYYTTLGNEAARKDTVRALGRATPFLRRQLAGRLRLRRVPELEFRFDQSVEHQDRIERLIHQIQEERAAVSAAASDEEGQEAGAKTDDQQSD